MPSALIFADNQWFLRRWLTAHDKVMQNPNHPRASSDHADIFVQCWFMKSRHGWYGGSLFDDQDVWLPHNKCSKWHSEMKPTVLDKPTSSWQTLQKLCRRRTGTRWFRISARGSQLEIEKPYPVSIHVRPLQPLVIYKWASNTACKRKLFVDMYAAFAGAQTCYYIEVLGRSYGPEWSSHFSWHRDGDNSAARFHSPCIHSWWHTDEREAGPTGAMMEDFFAKAE